MKNPNPALDRFMQRQRFFHSVEGTDYLGEGQSLRSPGSDLFSTSEINERNINFREKIEKMKKIMSSFC